MSPYVRFSIPLRSLYKAIQPRQLFCHQRETYRRVSTLPCFTLDDKVCVVTGASQGLGQQILAAFCLSGGHGAVVDLSLDSAQKSIETINAEVKEKGLPPAKLHPYECNTADEQGVKKTWNQIIKDFGKVDVLCTNARITGGVPAEDYDFNDWKGMLDVNVNGTFLFAKQAGQHMIEKHIKGSIIMVSTAVVQMIKSMASEWGEHGIRVNAISPGYIQTAANEGEEMEKLSKEWVKDIPLHRIAKPEEFRGTAVYMASDASSYLTGAQIVVDGGYTVW
ncbi:MAG: Uncharacterized protein AUREO_002950 [Aureobasidium pullulans]|nr:MAG: Uncharacterized protein AUREO_002950 [Aureobasidium pullulans]